MNLYQGEGQVVTRILDELKRLLDEQTADGPMIVNLTALGPTFEGKLLTPEDRRIPYLFRLYCDGVRELSLLKGVTREELLRLADVLRTDPRGIEDDLVTLIWQAGLDHVRYYAVDAFTSGADESAASKLAAESLRSRLVDAGELGRVQLALSAEDLRVLHADSRFQWVRSAYMPARASGEFARAAAKLRRKFNNLPEYDRFLDITGRVSGGDEASALVVDLFDSVLDKGDIDGIRAILGTLCDHPAEREALMVPERMARMGPLFEEHHEALMPVLEPLIEHATGALLELLTTLPPGEALEALEGILGEGGVEMTPFHARVLTDSKDQAAIIAAVEALGRIGSAQALQALAGVLSSTLTDVRRVALHAMQGKYHESARIGLGRALRDPDKENRLLALKVLGGSGDKRIAWSLLSAIESLAFKSMDPDEQSALYDALARLRDPRTLEHFRKVLNRKKLTVSRSSGPSQQQLAVQALGVMGTDGAREVLTAFKGKWHLSGAVKSDIKNTLARWGAQ